MPDCPHQFQIGVTGDFEAPKLEAYATGSRAAKRQIIDIALCLIRSNGLGQQEDNAEANPRLDELSVRAGSLPPTRISSQAVQSHLEWDTKTTFASVY